MCARLHEPQRIIPHSILIASDLLLLPSPIRQLDLMREEIAPSKRVPQPEMRP